MRFQCTCSPIPRSGSGSEDGGGGGIVRGGGSFLEKIGGFTGL